MSDANKNAYDSFMKTDVFEFFGILWVQDDMIEKTRREREKVDSDLEKITTGDGAN